MEDTKLEATFPFEAFLARDESSRVVGLEIHQEVPGYDEPLISSVTAKHPGAHNQALPQGLTRERIWPKK